MKPARTSIAISPNGKIAALGTPTRAPILWDLETGATRAPEDVNSSFSVTFSPNGRFLLSGNSDCTFHVYETSSLEVAAVLRSSGKVPSAAFSPDGKTLAVTSNTTKRIRLWNVPTWQELGSLSSYDQTLGGLAFLNGGKALAVTVGVPGRNKWEVFLWGERAPTSGTKRNETGQEVKQ